MNNQYLTIKEVAEIVGISTQAIYKQLPTRLQTYSKKVGNKTLLKNSVISEVYQKEIPTKFATNSTKVENIEHSSLQQLPTEINHIIEFLQEELKSKNQIIQDQSAKMDKLQEEINKQNEHSRQQSDKLISLMEQMNDLQRNNQILLAQGQSKFDNVIDTDSGGADTEIEQTQTVHNGKLNFWSKWFSKNNFNE